MSIKKDITIRYEHEDFHLEVNDSHSEIALFFQNEQGMSKDLFLMNKEQLLDLRELLNQVVRENKYE